MTTAGASSGLPAALSWSPQRASLFSAATTLAAEPSPWTAHGDSTTRASGQRRLTTWQMSCQTAPVALVATPITCGRAGSGRFRDAVEHPSAASLRLERLELEREVAETGRLDRGDVQLIHALRLEDVHAAVSDYAQPRPRFERGRDAVVAEEDAGELAPLVLEREVAVPGRRDGHAADLALDPDVAQRRLGSHERRGTARVTSLTPSIRSSKAGAGATGWRRRLSRGLDVGFGLGRAARATPARTAACDLASPRRSGNESHDGSAQSGGSVRPAPRAGGSSAGRSAQSAIAVRRIACGSRARCLGG